MHSSSSDTFSFSNRETLAIIGRAPTDQGSRTHHRPRRSIPGEACPFQPVQPGPFLNMLGGLGRSPVRIDKEPQLFHYHFFARRSLLLALKMKRSAVGRIFLVAAALLSVGL